MNRIQKNLDSPIPTLILVLIYVDQLEIWKIPFEGKPGIIHKSKITVNEVKSGDSVVLACDGLKDYLEEQKIIETLSSNPSDPAKELGENAIKGMKGRHGDNVTVVVLKVS